MYPEVSTRIHSRSTVINWHFFLCGFFAFELVSFVKCTEGWWWRGVGLSG